MDRVEFHLDKCSDCALLVAAAAIGLDDATDASRPIVSEVGVRASTSGAVRPRIEQRFEQRFELLDVLGRGSMGTVYRGRERSAGKIVAIKLLNERAANSSRDVLRFLREMKALESLEHPNIVRLLGVVTRSDELALVMEYLQGGTLRQRLRSGARLSPRRSLEVALEISDALAQAHHLGVIHRDVKPDNILFGTNERPRLADFGLARLAGEPTTTDHPLVGTIPYLSPEAIGGMALDAKVDVWALGVMSFEMLTGNRPFVADSPAATVAAIVSRPIPDARALHPELPACAADVLRRLLERDPRQRPSAREAGAALEAALRALDASPVESSPVPSASGSVRPERSFLPAGAIPVPTTPFIGRKQELARVLGALEQQEARLVSIIAPGGMGKTRLAIEAARVLEHRATADGAFVDGVRFVDLTRIGSSELVAHALAAALSIAPTSPSDTPQRLFEYLRDKHVLLVLDNFEHVVSAAGLIGALLEAAPHVKVLTTSREALQLGSEMRVHLDGMRRAPGEDAVELFMDVAHRNGRVHELPEHRAAIVRISESVQGSPLGIILAASWVNVLSPPEIADEVARSLDFLRTDRRDVPDRQRSLRAVFDSTWSLLTADERDAFARLSVFRGGFQRHAAEAVAGATAGKLATLAAKSLIGWDQAEGRYQVHELLRQYGEEKLASDPDRSEHVREQLATYVVRFLVAQKAALQGPEQSRAIREMEREAANLREGWSWLLRHGRVESVESAIWGLLLFHFQRGARVDAEAALADVATQFEPFEAHGARGAKLGTLVFSFLGILSASQGQSLAAITRLERARSLATGSSDSAEHGLSLVASGWLVAESDNCTARLEEAERGLEMARTGGASWELAFTLMLMARVYLRTAKRPERAEACLLESLDVQRERFDEVVIPSVLAGIAVLRRLRGDATGALASALDGWKLSERLGDRWCAQDCLQLAAEIQLDTGDVDASEASVMRCFEIGRASGSSAYVAWCDLHLGDIMSVRGRTEDAQSHYERTRAASERDSALRAAADMRLARLAAARGQDSLTRASTELTRLDADVARATASG